jgi:hypothetical protein
MCLSGKAVPEVKMILNDEWEEIGKKWILAYF